MIKKFVIVLLLLSMVFVMGCEEISSLTQGGTGASSPESPKILKAVELGSEWEMKQMTFKVEAGDELSVLLKLPEGEKVDGYFYLEKGDSINFEITGKTPVYKSEGEDGKGGGGVSSDRFSFITSQAQGNMYTLTFYNDADDDRPNTVTVFLEIIYPVSGSIYVPVEGE